MHSNARLTFHKSRVSKQEERRVRNARGLRLYFESSSRFYIKWKVRLHFKWNLCLGKTTEPHLFNKVRAASPLRCSPLFNEWDSRFYFRRGLRLQGNMTFASTRLVFSLCFCNQFNSIWTKAVDDFSRFNSTPITSSEHRWGLDCVSKHSRRLSLVASKSLTVHSRSPKSRQDQAQGISEDYQSSLESLLPKETSKVFRNPSQSTAEFWKLWGGFYKLSKNHWRQIRQMQCS